MPVDQTSLDRIRNATFPSARRGYDKHEVDEVPGAPRRLARDRRRGRARSDAGQDASSSGSASEPARSWPQAEESAQEIRAEAEEEARGTVNAANLEADRDPRSRRTTYATETRTSAERQAREARRGRARRRLAGSSRTRISDARTCEVLIGDLIRRRGDVIADTEELSRKLSRPSNSIAPRVSSCPSRPAT